MKHLLLSSLMVLFIIGCSDKSTNPNDNPQFIKIGAFEWSKTNLNVDHYKNGEKIPEVKDPVEWSNLTTGAWCYYNNDPEMGKIYGRLYNWYAVNDSRGLAPAGFHVATNNEWENLINSQGGEDIAGGKLKEDGLDDWNSPNTGATNSSGFTALPGGGRDTNGVFMTNKYYGAWWTSSYTSPVTAWYKSMAHITEKVYSVNYKVRAGFAIRVVKD